MTPYAHSGGRLAEVKTDVVACFDMRPAERVRLLLSHGIKEITPCLYQSERSFIHEELKQAHSSRFVRAHRTF